MTVLIYTLVGLVILFPLIVIIWKKPDFFFWLFLNLFFDPGGFIQGFLGGNIFWRINVTDVFIFFIVLCLWSSQVNRKLIYGDEFLIKFIKFFIIFFIYYFVLYGGVIPYLNKDFDYYNFLLKNRPFIYGFIIFISVYLFTLRGLKYFYSVTLFFGFVCLTLYWITLLTGIELIPISVVERYRGSGIIRMGMLSYGLFDILFSLAFISFILSRKVIYQIKYKRLLYFVASLMVLTLILTLTRRTGIHVVGEIFIIIFITSYLFRTAKMTSLLRITIPSILIIFMLYLTFPKYVDYALGVAEDTVLLVITGQDSRGLGDYRLSGSGDLLISKEYISQNIWFGTGYTYLYWGQKDFATSPRGDDFARAADAAGEVPIYYLFFGLGVVGAILVLPLYIIMVKLFFKIIKLLRKNIVNYLNYPLTIIFSLYFLLNIASKFSVKVYALGSDFIGDKFSGTAVFLGIGFALYLILRENEKSPHSLKMGLQNNHSEINTSV